MSELKLPEINRVLLSGRLTRDPDLRYAGDGTEVTRFGLAFHRRYRSRDGTPAEQTGYVNVITYQRLAEVCGQYLKKGSAVLVEGRLQMREWASPSGEPESRLEVRGEMVHFLERRGDAPAVAADPPAARAERPAPKKPAEGGELF